MPINQEQLVGTLLTFSHVVLRGMRKNGLAIDEATLDAYAHTWNVVGSLLGIDQGVLRTHLATYPDARRMLLAIRRRNIEHTKDGERLASELIQYYRDNCPFFLRFAPLIATRLLSGRDVSKAVRVRYALWHYPLVPFVKLGLLLFGWLKNFAWTQAISNWFFDWLSHNIWVRRDDPQGDDQQGWTLPC